MCGIGGILRVWTPEQRELALRTPHGESIPEEWLDILDDAVKHRGPDGQGRFRDRAVRADGCVVDVAFVHRRLSIIDHAGGHQPMVLEVPRSRDSEGALSASSGGSRPIPGRLLSVEELATHNRRVLAEAHAVTSADPGLALRALSSQDRIAVVFNGCIYNHRELRAELQNAGHVFATDHSDTEVLVHGWREWGDQLFGRLEAMHALALWDDSSGTLALSRDSFGEKPLHLWHARRNDSWVNVFASVPPVAMTLPGVIGPSKEDVRPISKPWFWVRFGFGPDAPVAGSRAVRVGHAMVYSPDDPSESSGQPDGSDPPPPRSFHHGVPLPPRGNDICAEDVELLLSEAVLSRLESDVPLGCFLSGGVDSSLITLLAKRHLGRVATFTVRMPVAEYDESAYAERVAKVLDTDHQTLSCSANPADDLVHLIQQAGIPLGDSSLLPAYWLCRAAGTRIRVALSGDGGDELFGGYERYGAARWLFTGVAGASAVGRLVGAAASPKSTRAKAARFLEACGGVGYQDLLSIFPSRFMDEILVGPTRDAERSWRASSKTPLSAAQAIAYDVSNYLPNDLMQKADIASMSVPLEIRAPFLDKTLASRMLAAKMSDLLPNGERKGLLRQVARKYLPAEIVDRPKMGFAIPIGEWFRSDYGGLRTMLLDHLNSTEPFGPPSLGIDLNMKFIRQMLDEHLGTGPSGRVVRDHSQRLYMLLVLSIWAKWLGGLGKSG